MKSKSGVLAGLIALSASAGLLGGLLGAWLMGPSARAAQSAPSPEQVLTAREIRLVDEQGRIWARLGSSPIAVQHRGLILNDEAGRERLRLAASGQGNGGLVLSDAQGRFRAALTLSSTGLPGAALTDQAGKMRFLLHVAQQGSPQMDFYDAQGRIGLGLEVSEAGNPELRMSREGPESGTALLDPSSLAFQSQGSRQAVLIGVDAQKEGRIQLFDSQGQVSEDLPAKQASGSQR